jgi:hypothetical protein
LDNRLLIPGSRGYHYEGSNQLVHISSLGLKPGDILHSGEQVSVFYKAQGASGILNQEDLVFQAQPGGPAISTLRENGYYPSALKAYRWKEAGIP